MAVSGSTAFASGLTRRLDKNEELARAKAKEDRANKIQDEALAYGKSRRAANEGLVTAQTEANAASAAERRAKIQREADAAKEKARSEGLEDMINDLDNGMDVGSAAARYNMRGAHRIDPSRIQYDPKTKRLRIEDPTEGTLDATTDQIRKGLQQTRGRDAKPVSVPKGGTLVNPATSGVVYQDTRPAAGDTQKDYTLKPGDVRYSGTTGKVIARGPPKETGGGKGGGSGPGGRKLATFNPDTWQGAARKVAGERLGGKFDDKGTFFPAEGTSGKYSDYSAAAQRIGRKIGYALSPDEVVNVIADRYDELRPFDDYVKDAVKAVPYEQKQMLGNATGRLSQQQYDAARRADAKRAYDRDKAAADADIDRVISQTAELARAEAEASGMGAGGGEDEASSGDAAEDATDPGDEGGEENPNDNVPAVEAGAAPAPARAAAAPRRYVFTDPKTKKATQLDVSDGLTKRLKSLPAGSRLPDPRVPGLFWVLGPDGSPRPQ